MTRSLHANLLADIGLVTAAATWFLELRFSGGTIFITTAPQDILWGGNTYQAVGGNFSFDPYEESPDDRGGGFQLTLGGVDQAYIAILLTQQYRGRLAILTYAHLSQSAGTIVLNPVEVFRGFMNEAFTIEEVRPAEGGGTCTIRTRLVSRLAELDQVRGLRTNLTTHQALFAGDTFFRTVESIAGRVIRWGKAGSIAQSLGDALANHNGGFSGPAPGSVGGAAGGFGNR